MTIYSSMPYKTLQPSIPTMFFPHKLRSLTFGSKLEVASLPFFFSPNSFPSNLFPTRCLNSNAPTASSGGTTHCFHVVDTTVSEPWDYDDDEAASRRGYYSKSNALLFKGPRGSFVTNKREEGMSLRIDVPGVGIDGVRVWVENDSILCFEGKSRKEKYMGVRSYGGGFIFCPDTYDLNNKKGFLKNGVFRMMIPKRKVIFPAIA